MRVVDGTGAKLDDSVPLSVQLAQFDGTPVGSPVTASAVLPEGARQHYFVAPMDIPSPGAWKLKVTAGQATGDITIQALDPGDSLSIGGPAPDIDTPTLDDVGGVVRAVTTQPNPDLRLSKTSTADARAMGKPYVIVIDSARFKVSPECGRALTMIRYPAGPLGGGCGLHPPGALRVPGHHRGAGALRLAHRPPAEQVLAGVRPGRCHLAGHEDALDLRGGWRTGPCARSTRASWAARTCDVILTQIRAEQGQAAG